MASFSYSKWDVCIADVPFEDRNQSKIRPVVILDYNTIVDCLKATSAAPRANSPADYQLKMWGFAGLRKPTVVRVSKRIEIEQSRIVRKIGSLHPRDVYEIQKLILQVYGNPL